MKLSMGVYLLAIILISAYATSGCNQLSGATPTALPTIMLDSSAAAS